jgi:tetratricopeptide (TPR) repeat protein
MTLEQALRVAMERHQAGRLADAEAIYRQVLTAFPDHADALHLLGLLASQVGRADVAIGLISQAFTIDPRVVAYHSNLGNVLKEQGRLDEALAATSRRSRSNRIAPRFTATWAMRCGARVGSMRRWPRWSVPSSSDPTWPRSRTTSAMS